jgi:excisionase family DNA binding protein
MDVTPLYVRIPKDDADRLDRASFESGKPKRELVTDALRQHFELGHHEFRPTAQDVLTLAQAAELLQVDEKSLAELAEKGDLPGRRIGEDWRFARQALLDWLSAAD